jgi:hypothetical protein
MTSLDGAGAGSWRIEGPDDRFATGILVRRALCVKSPRPLSCSASDEKLARLSGGRLMAPPAKELKNTGYEIFIGILSILSIVNIFLLYGFRYEVNLQNVLDIMNVLLSGIFMIDFVYRILTASSKAGYFFRGFGWADLLASLPFAQLKFLRIFRLLRVIRLLRDFGIKNIARSLVKDRAGSALLILLLMGILVLEFGSLEILSIELHYADANIKTASAAIWYVLVTISTVGYGDRYPVSNYGRLFAALIIVIGVGIFGTFTGYLANLFLSPAKKEPAKGAAAAAPNDPRVELEQLKLLMIQQQAAVAEIERKLATGGDTTPAPPASA